MTSVHGRRMRNSENVTIARTLAIDAKPRTFSANFSDGSQSIEASAFSTLKARSLGPIFSNCAVQEPFLSRCARARAQLIATFVQRVFCSSPIFNSITLNISPYISAAQLLAAPTNAAEQEHRSKYKWAKQLKNNNSLTQCMERKFTTHSQNICPESIKWCFVCGLDIR